MNLTKKYENGRGVFDVNLHFESTGVYAVMGHNGSGKTSLFRMLAGLIEPSSGIIEWKNIEKVSYIPEQRALYQEMTVKDHLKLIGKLKKMSSAYFNLKYKELMNMLNMWQYEHNLIQSLSKGNQQKVQFMIALLTQPDLLVLDEPFTGLDIINVKILKKVLTHYKNQGTRIILSSHQYDEIEDFADHILLLKEGKTVLQGPLRDIRNKFDITYLSVGDDYNQKYKNHTDVVEVETYGHVSRYKISASSKLVSLAIKERNNSKIVIEGISIKDLVAKHYE